MAYTFKHGDRPLDDYAIQRAIGRGGFGEVYYAMSDGGREVALKYLKENPAVELRGVSHCINLKSPFLVSIFDVKKNSEGDYFIIMEYCSGPSLRDLMIAEPKGFSPEKAAFFTREIAKGLSYLHDRGIVHRDLKPGNIFFDDGYVKIGDYGLSKFISVSRHSAQTASVGTVHYMAPEIGSGNYSRGVDIYALGVMLYEMLLGKVPFEGSSMAEVLMKHLTAQPELDELPAPFGKVIRKALEKDPKDRYQTAEEMLDDLLSGEEIQRSLAGFSTKSLEGAVRIGGRDRLDSPIPSPNPPPRSPGGFVFKADIGRGAPDASALPDRLAKKLDRISHKIDRKMSKLAGKRGWNPPPAAPGGEGANPAGIPWALPAPPRGERGKRMVLLFMLLAGLSVGLGVAVGNSYRSTNADQVGAAAGMLVAALYFGVLIGGRAVRWFGVQSGPGWANKLVRGIAAVPLLAVGCAPIFELGIGLSVWLALSVLAAIKDWESAGESGDKGEICFGPIFGNAIVAMVLTAIAGLITGEENHPQRIMFISAGAAAAATFVLQAGAWWTVHHRAGAPRPAGAGVPSGDTANGTQIEGACGTHPTAPPPPAPFAPAVPAGSWTAAPATPEAPSGRTLIDPPGRRPRGVFARMFWSVAAFVLMGGAIVTFLYSLIASPDNPHDMTAAVILCTGFAAFMIFALRKTTPLRRPGFWRESLRPLLISVSLFGIGATTTGIAREWNCTYGSPEDCESGIDRWEQQVRERGLNEDARVRVQQQIREARREIAIKGKITDALLLWEMPPYVGLEGQQWRFHERCVSDEDRVALVAGLVMSSLMFLGLTFFTGGKPRASRAPRPFLRESGSDPSAASERTSGGAGSASVDATAAGERT
ncbi:MAG: serine/threonine-protein kinase [Phycisphaerales bacterium]|nr:serine/threonine-protein kinase [Phycisphaerales bacterium]